MIKNFDFLICQTKNYYLLHNGVNLNNLCISKSLTNQLLIKKMSCPLPADCLNEIFENLDDDKITLHSCLLVSRLWCKISVRILWRNIWRFKYNEHDSRSRWRNIIKASKPTSKPTPTLRLGFRVASAIFNTL